MNFAMTTDVTQLFDECLPVEIQSAISGALTRAYDFTEALILKNPLLGGALSGDVRPHIRRVAVDACLKELDGSVQGLRALIRPNAVGNCQHVELHAKRIVLTANYVEAKRQMPRSAVFRKAFSQALNMSLFADEPLEVLPERPYAHIIHGGLGRKPSFVVVTIPDVSGQYAVYSRSLAVAAHSTDAPVEHIHDAVVSQLKISIQNEGTGTN
ncbi:hypothetical protein [Chitinasiproducens palmae]|uniref:hypothetical protein n=1 Tax=Chitinasiproducens palmae TaxID=1770053 RepID=UPI001480B6B5|nr:hypothetical protein [Chitinasiproducens palmae]